MTRVTTACVWCGRPTHAVDSVCPACIGIDRRNHSQPTDDDALTDGAWRFDPFRRIQVWVPAEPVEPDLHQLIACPTCHALATQACRTKRGTATTPHRDRTIPRQCECGTVLEPNRKRCDECVDEARRMRQRRQRARRSGRLATITHLDAQTGRATECANTQTWPWPELVRSSG